MITSNQIVRMIETKDYGRLVDRLMTNGRCHSRVGREALRAPQAAAASALGLALQRLCEITYWPHPDGATLAQQLVRLQRRDGAFGSTPDVAATAVALRGLIDWLAQHDRRGVEAGSVDDRLTLVIRSIARGWEAIERTWREAGAAGKRDDPAQRDDVGWAIVLWQLADCDEAREHLPINEIRRSLTTSSSAAVLTDDLSRLALTMAA